MSDINDVEAGLQKLAALTEPKLNSERILVVDDEPFILEASGDYLEDLGYEVRKAGAAAEAVQIMLDGFHPHLLLSDIVLPGGMNGVELARRVHEIMPDVKVLLASGYGAGAIDGATNSDGFTLLSKPYGMVQLGDRVRDILDGGA